MALPSRSERIRAAPMRHRRHCGAGIVEVMVGITIALFAVLVIYVVVATAAHLRRASQSAADAQQTALFALSRLSFDIANAGNGFVAAAKALATCPASADVADTLRPVTVLIGDSGHDNAPDDIVVRYGVAPTIAGAATFAAAAPAGASFLVQSPAGFAAGDHVIAVGRNGVCAATDVTSATASSAGVIEIAHAPLAESFPASSWLVNLGRLECGNATRRARGGARAHQGDSHRPHRAKRFSRPRHQHRLSMDALRLPGNRQIAVPRATVRIDRRDAGGRIPLPHIRNRRSASERRLESLMSAAMRRIRGRARGERGVVVLIALILPLAVDGLGNSLSLRSSPGWIRAFTGLAAGVALPLLLNMVAQTPSAAAAASNVSALC